MNDRAADLPRFRIVVFSLLPLVLLLGLAEGILRLVGEAPGAAASAVEMGEFTFPLEDWRSRDGVRFLERDPLLFWKPRPNVAGHNSLGLYGDEIAVPKPPGIFRIVALGDSCTHFGPRPYPARLEEMLEVKTPRRFEVVNAAVLGWTSHQGLKRLETEVPDWQPDLLTVYFGWNDHYLARGFTDREQPVVSPGLANLERLLAHSRLWSWLRALTTSDTPPERLDRFRVPPEDYADNLRAMKNEANRLGAEIWFLTTPHALDLGIPAFLVESGEVADPAKLLEIHRDYNDIVRRVGRELGVRVVDLAREIDRMDKTILFEDDHIHLSDRGRTLAAAILYATLLDHGYLAVK